MINYSRVGQLINAALQLEMPADVRVLLQAAFVEMNPPPPPADVPVADLPGVVRLASGPFVGMYQHLRTGQIRVSLDGPEGMRDYVNRLGERDANLAAGPSWEDVYAKRAGNTETPAAPQPRPDEETPL